MKEIIQMPIADKIALLKEIKSNYGAYKNVWTTEKVEWLKSLVVDEIQDIGSFDLKNTHPTSKPLSIIKCGLCYDSGFIWDNVYCNNVKCECEK